MQYESKNGQMKKFVSHNVKNIPLTTATYHQQRMCYNLAAKPGEEVSNFLYAGDEVSCIPCIPILFNTTSVCSSTDTDVGIGMYISNEYRYIRTYIRIYVCMYVCTYIHTYVHMYMYVRTYIRMYVYMYVLRIHVTEYDETKGRILVAQ